MPGTRSAFAERAVSGYYLDIDIDRAAAARYGLNVGDVQTVIATAVGGMTATRPSRGGSATGSHPLSAWSCVTIRNAWPRSSFRSATGSKAVHDPAMGGGMGGIGPGGVSPGRETYVPLGQIATIRQVAGPMVVRTEGAQLTAWVYIDVADRDIGSYVAEARQAVECAVVLPAGYTIVWSGQYEYMQRAAAKLKVVVPATLAIIFLLLYFNFGNLGEIAIVMLSLPFALVGGLWFIWLPGYNWSVAVAIGFVALNGVAAETGVIMLIYLDHAWQAKQADGRTPTLHDLYDAVMEGAVERVRPKLMTVTAIMAGLLPILWGTGAGASVMKRIAAPMVGGMVSSTVLTLLVIPAVYSLWKERAIVRAAALGSVPAPTVQ